MDFGERLVVFDTGSEFFIETNFLAEINPVFLVELGHLREGGFAGLFKVVVPNSGNSEIVIIPEFAFVAGTVRSNGGILGIDGVGFTVFVEEVGEADFEEDVIIFEILLELFFVFDDGVFEGDTIWADNVGIDDEVILSFRVTDGHGFVPHFVAVTWFGVHTGNDGGE